ncbi:nucleotidyltransferase family protein [Actinomadura fibrosa]|uniref:Sugar phosphate nucleotidyltransferase n=1 Tax=Actinomadura fibrosa TaxID=111802 RepID=A0ABW2XS87_9ACTN|nr:NDP-sugar synthase [Actinomadura fibrosa]
MRPAAWALDAPGPGEDVSVIALVGGDGVRARPLSLSSGDYQRSKAAIALTGRTVIEWVVRSLRAQRVSRFYIVAKGRENRLQTKALLGHGDGDGVQIRYSRARFDLRNTGSGEATLRALDHWDLTGLALVVPTDSVFDLDLAGMVRAHRAADAVVTVASVRRTPAEAAGKYGVLAARPDGRVTRFVEKPSREDAEFLAAGGTVHTNAGIYLVDCDRLRLLAASRDLADLAARRLDWGGDLLPWLVRRGEPVLAHAIGGFGDLGNPRDYLRTVRDVLAGRYPLFSEEHPDMVQVAPGVRVHESSLHAKSRATGRTLAASIAAGDIRIGPNVRIGRDAEIGPGASLADCDVGDGVDIGGGAVIRGVACGDSSMVGPGARLSDTYLGSMVDIRSDRRRPVVLEDFCALGDEVRVGPGVRLRGVLVYPRMEVRDTFAIPPGGRLTGVRDLVRRG